MDLLYALAAFVLLLTYATIAVAVGAIIAEQLRDRCDSSHVYCWHDVNGYFFGAFWPLIFSGLAVAWLAKGLIYMTHPCPAGNLWQVVNGDCSTSYRLGSWEWAVRISEGFMRCVGFVGCKDGGQTFLGGTCFFVEFDWMSALVVTARHVLGKIVQHHPGCDPVLWLNSPDGLREVETSHQDWVFHPDDTTVDAAVLTRPVLMAGWDHSAVAKRDFVSDEYMRKFDVGAGDDLYFPGLFARHKGRAVVEPILRRGTLAAVPREPVQTDLGPAQAYLAEVHSIGGFSGSPVFLEIGPFRAPAGITKEGMDEMVRVLREESGPRDAFLGLVHGHYDTDALLSGSLPEVEKVNMGITVITPAQRIREVIEQPEVQRMRKDEPSEPLPVMDEAPPTTDFDAVIIEDSTLDKTADLLGHLMEVPKDEARGGG